MLDKKTGKCSSPLRRNKDGYKTAFCLHTQSRLLKSVSNDNVLFQFVGGEKVDFLLCDCKDGQLKATFLSCCPCTSLLYSRGGRMVFTVQTLLFYCGVPLRDKCLKNPRLPSTLLIPPISQNTVVLCDLLCVYV